MEKGTIDFFDAELGFGRIAPESGLRVTFASRVVEANGNLPRRGKSVEFERTAPGSVDAARVVVMNDAAYVAPPPAPTQE